MNFLRRLTTGLLLLLGIGAVAGALPMLFHPDGAPLGMSQSLLAHSPFHSFFIPGLVLLVAIGILPLIVALAALSRARDYGWYTAAAGAILTGWIVLECIFLRVVAWPHYLYAAWGLTLVLLGLVLRNDRQTQS